MVSEEIRLEGLRRLKEGVRVADLVHFMEWAALAACVLSLAYFVYGLFSPDPLPGRELLWKPALARRLGVSAGIGYLLVNLLHLLIYPRLESRLVSASSDVDNYYAQRGFEELPEEIPDLVARYGRHLEPIFLERERGLIVNALAGAGWILIALVLSSHIQ